MLPRIKRALTRIFLTLRYVIDTPTKIWTDSIVTPNQGWNLTEMLFLSKPNLDIGCINIIFYSIRFTIPAWMCQNPCYLLLPYEIRRPQIVLLYTCKGICIVSFREAGMNPSLSEPQETWPRHAFGQNIQLKTHLVYLFSNKNLTGKNCKRQKF